MEKVDGAYIIVGKIGSTYGIRGWLKIQTYTEYSASILEYTPWFLENLPNEWQCIKLEEGRLQGKAVVAKLAGINTPEEARLLTGKNIGVLRSQLPNLNKNEYYWSDLEGLTVINRDGKILGKIIYLMETGANDVLVVKGEKEQAIPYLLGSVVISIDLIKREMHVDWNTII